MPFQASTLRYVDSLIVVIAAMDAYVKDGHNFSSPNYEEGLCGTKDVDVRPWSDGERFFSYILDVSLCPTTPSHPNFAF